eukprot:scaffold3428_cov379-Prasinococcus_capsulatus_cf.AAC.16
MAFSKLTSESNNCDLRRRRLSHLIRTGCRNSMCGICSQSSEQRAMQRRESSSRTRWRCRSTCPCHGALNAILGPSRDTQLAYQS